MWTNMVFSEPPSPLSCPHSLWMPPGHFKIAWQGRRNQWLSFKVNREGFWVFFYFLIKIHTRLPMSPMMPTALVTIPWRTNSKNIHLSSSVNKMQRGTEVSLIVIIYTNRQMILLFRNFLKFRFLLKLFHFDFFFIQTEIYKR